MENKPRIPAIWLHGLECTCCSESFIRSSHPIAQDIVLNMISLDYDDTLQAAAGDQVEEIPCSSTPTSFRNGLITSIISGYKFYQKGDLDHDKWLS